MCGGVLGASWRYEGRISAFRFIICHTIGRNIRYTLVHNCSHIASIVRHLESKCCIYKMYLESLFFHIYSYFSQIASIFTFSVDIFSHLATFSQIRGIFTFEGATSDTKLTLKRTSTRYDYIVFCIRVVSTHVMKDDKYTLTYIGYLGRF